MLNEIRSPFDPLYNSKRINPMDETKNNGKLDFNDYKKNGKEFIDYEKYAFPLPYEVPLFISTGFYSTKVIYIDDEKAIEKGKIDNYDPIVIKYLKREIPDFRGYPLSLFSYFKLFPGN